MHTTKLASGRGKRMRVSSTTKGSRMKAIITATIEVMKKTRPKYSTAMMTPIATTGMASWRASCAAFAALAAVPD